MSPGYIKFKKHLSYRPRRKFIRYDVKRRTVSFVLYILSSETNAFIRNSSDVRNSTVKSNCVSSTRCFAYRRRSIVATVDYTLKLEKRIKVSADYASNSTRFVLIFARLSPLTEISITRSIIETVEHGKPWRVVRS